MSVCFLFTCALIHGARWWSVDQPSQSRCKLPHKSKQYVCLPPAPVCWRWSEAKRFRQGLSEVISTPWAIYANWNYIHKTFDGLLSVQQFLYAVCSSRQTQREASYLWIASGLKFGGVLILNCASNFSWLRDVISQSQGTQKQINDYIYMSNYEQRGVVNESKFLERGRHQKTITTCQDRMNSTQEG